MKRFFSLVAILLVQCGDANQRKRKSLVVVSHLAKALKRLQHQSNKIRIRSDKIKLVRTQQQLQQERPYGWSARWFACWWSISCVLGGAFEGIQFMDILIMGLIVFLAFKFYAECWGRSKAP